MGRHDAALRQLRAERLDEDRPQDRRDRRDARTLRFGRRHLVLRGGSPARWPIDAPTVRRAIDFVQAVCTAVVGVL
jgi:hypothetical protein